MSDPNDSVAEAAVSLRQEIPERSFVLARAQNLWGTPRRFFLNVFRADYVKRSVAMREGDCNRCGLCCQLVVKCVFLRFDDGLAACGRYETRPANCSQFPIDQADIDAVNRIAPHAPCGFSFRAPCGKKGG